MCYALCCLHLSPFSWFSVGSHALVPLDLDLLGQQGAGRLGVKGRRM